MRPIVTGGVGGVALFFLDAFGRLAGVVIVDVGDGDDLDIGLFEEGIEELTAPAAGADQAQPDPVAGRWRRSQRRGPRQRDSHRPKALPPQQNRAA